MSKMVPPHPNPAAVPASWKYADVRPSLMEAGDIIDAEEAERRVLMLVNPAMGRCKLLRRT
jgi:gentisate 1,2-dioxygenase